MRWQARRLHPTEGRDPLGQSRTFAILQAAVHDAVNAIDVRYLPYTAGLALAPGASVDAAVAAASRAVMVALVPGQVSLIEDAYLNALATIDEGPPKAAGIAAGQASAAATLARRQNDGFTAATQPIYLPNGPPGVYQFTAPFDIANLPGWGRLTPFAIDVTDHQLAGPLRLSSGQYARDFAEVKSIGARTSTTRTADQSQIAQFWYEDSPLGWNRIAVTVMSSRARRMAGRPHAGPRQLRDRRWLHRRIRRQVRASVLASGDGDPAGGRRRQPAHAGRSGVGAVSPHPTGA